MAMFLGFALACQLVAIAILAGPLIFFDVKNSPILSFPKYMQFYGVAVFVLSSSLFLFRFFLHVNDVKQSVHFEHVTQRDEPRLCKIIEVQAIGAGIALPRVGVIEDQARNAFACGMSERSSVIVVTRGLINALDDDELEAVIAHEITHIVNGDIQLMAVANVMLSTLYLIQTKNPFQKIRKKLFFLYFFIPPLLMLYLLTGFVSKLGMTLGKFSRLLIASSREFIADAEAVRMTKNPAALISALKRIDGRSDIEGLDASIDAMMIDGAVEGAYASHPTIAERIAVLSQHAGAMVYGAGTRKDTRNRSRFAENADGVFGRKIEETAIVGKTPAKSLFKRVNADSNENSFGLTPVMRICVLAGMGAPIVLSSLLSYRMSDAATAVGGSSQHVSNKISSKARANEDLSWIEHKRTAAKLAAIDPLNSRCFGHQNNPYHVGDRGLKTFRKPDASRVNAMVEGKIRRRSDIDVARYASLRISSQRAVRSAVDYKSLDVALIKYVNQRKSLLEVMHRFYGKKGLNWMRKTYESSQDAKIVKRLSSRFLQGDVVDKRNEIYLADPKRSGKFLHDIALLVDNSRDFIPCYARVVLGTSKQNQVAKATVVKAAAPTIPLIKTTLRGSN